MSLEEKSVVSKKVLKTTDEYITSFPLNVQTILNQIRQDIRDVAPEAEEVISYQMPAFKLKGILVYFAAWKNHVGFYGASSTLETFKKELTGYEVSKGTIKFSLDKPIPHDLIKKIVKYRAKENLNKK
jgi:uncharacterized protein YdhG (YjbR/CyaY superfamily)